MQFYEYTYKPPIFCCGCPVSCYQTDTNVRLLDTTAIHAETAVECAT